MATWRRSAPAGPPTSENADAAPRPAGGPPRIREEHGRAAGGGGDCRPHSSTSMGCWSARWACRSARSSGWWARPDFARWSGTRSSRPRAATPGSSCRGVAGPRSRASSPARWSRAWWSTSSAFRRPRHGAQKQGEARPLLAGVDPVQRMLALLQEREQFYSLAPHQVDTERAEAAAVAASIVDLARKHGGW